MQYISSSCVLFLALSSPCLAQTIVGDGADFEAIVAASPSGTVIEIQSDQTFVGTLDWDDKDLTLRAGEGLTPSIEGDPGLPVAVLADEAATGTTGARFEGLRLIRGATDPGPWGPPGLQPAAFEFTGDGFGPPRALVFALDDCIIEGDLRVSGESGVAAKAAFTLDGSVVDSQLDGHVTIAAGDADDVTLAFERSSVADFAAVWSMGFDLELPPNGALRFVDCVVGSPGSGYAHDVLGLGPTGTAALEFRRSRVFGRVEASASSSATTATSVELDLESSILRSSESFQTGLLVAGGFSAPGVVKARAVNVTIAGFATGLRIEGQPQASVENSLVFLNGVDIDPQTPASAVSYSLIGQGTYAWQNGNIGGFPQIDCDYALQPGSLGVDAGNPQAAGLGTLDLDGHPRQQDGDGDGIARVSIGAHETLAPPPASATIVNGSGVNPADLAALSAPLLGEELVLAVGLGPATVATIVVFDAPAPTPFPNPFGSGEILVALSAGLLIDVAAPGAGHTVLVPNVVALSGASLHAQALRLEFPGPGSYVEASNALALLFGDC